MQLRRVRVRNIRSYEAADVAFPTGTTLLAGDVGSGKTSLLYAIEMALFGGAEVDPAYLVRHGAAHAEVEVELEGDGHRYWIRRRFRRVQRRGRPAFEPERISFSVDGATTQYSATELRQRVIELLGFPDNPRPQAHSELWRWAVYVPQEKMREILSADAQERLETVRRALGVERYRIAAENAQELASDLRRSVAARRAEAERLAHHDRDHAAWAAEADRLHLDRSRLAGTIAERSHDVEVARARRSEAEGAVREMEGLRTVRESLGREEASDDRALRDGDRARAERSTEFDRLTSEARAAHDEAANLEIHQRARADAEVDRDRDRVRLDELALPLRQLAEVGAEYAATARAASELRVRLSRAEKEATAARDRRDAVRAEGPAREPPAPTPLSLPLLDERLADARATERSTLAALTLADRSVTELAELVSAGTCPRCGQPVRAAEFAPHRAEAERDRDTARAAHAEAEAGLARLEDERKARERYERSLERWTEIEKRRAMADRAVEAAESELAAARTATASADEALARCDGRRTELAGAEAEEHAARSALDAAERHLRETNGVLDRSVRAAERLGAIEAARAAISSELRRRAEELEALRHRREERRERILELDRALEAASARADSLAQAERLLSEAETAFADEQRVLVRVDTRLDEAARRLEEAERGRAERAELVREADDLAAKAAWVSGPFRSALLAMEQELLANAQAAFERSFARYFASLVDDPALLARTDAAFTPAVTIEDEWTPAEALSGGERTSLALAFRLALAHVVRSLGSLRLETILLDEPTDGFSPEQVVRMGELLDELGLPQVVLVSHEGELAAIADRVLRVEKRGGRSSVLPADGAIVEPSAPEVPSEAEPATEPSPRAPPRRRRAVR